MSITKNTKKIAIGHAPGVGSDAEQVKTAELNVATLRHYVVLRPKDPNIAEKAAKICKLCCDNDYITYSMGFRDSLWDYIKPRMARSELDYSDIERIINEIDAVKYVDCSSFMAVCFKACGVNITGLPNTSDMETDYKSTGAFDVLKTKKYLESLDYLKRGDIIVERDDKTPTSEYNHATMILGNGALAYLDDIVSTFNVSPQLNITNTELYSVTVLIDTELSNEVLSEFTWNFDLRSCETGAIIKQNSKVNFTGENILAGLNSNTAYFLKIVGTPKKSNGEKIGSGNVIFVTKPERPKSVSNIALKQLNKTLPIKNFYLSFDHSKKFVDTKEFYRIWLAVNGNPISYIDSFESNQVLTIENFGIKDIAVNSQVQVGIQVGYEFKKETFIFDSNFPKWSLPIRINIQQKLINKIFMKLQNTFARVLIHEVNDFEKR